MNKTLRDRLKAKYLRQLNKTTNEYSDSLIEEIRMAFRNIEYPKVEFFAGDKLHNLECSECEECHTHFVGKTWEQCLEQSDLKLYGCQSFFKPTVWHYFLPAYLIQSICHKRFSLSEFDEFNDADLPEVTEWQRRKNELLSYDQSKVILKYVKMTHKIWKDIDSGVNDNQKTLEFWETNCLQAQIREGNR